MLALLIEPFNNPDLNRAAGLCLNTMNKQRETTHIAESSVLTTTLMLPHMILHHDTSEGLISISSSRCSGCRILTAFHLLYYWEFDRHGLTEVQQICPDHEFPAIHPEAYLNQRHLMMVYGEVGKGPLHYYVSLLHDTIGRTEISRTLRKVSAFNKKCWKRLLKAIKIWRRDTQVLSRCSKTNLCEDKKRETLQSH